MADRQPDIAIIGAGLSGIATAWHLVKSSFDGQIDIIERLRQTAAWFGHYDYNTFDQNGLIGRDPAHEDLFHITGFSGHGVQQAPAAGEALASLIMTGGFEGFIDCTDLAPERIALGQPFVEKAII